jgi:hypothetical protein
MMANAPNVAKKYLLYQKKLRSKLPTTQAEDAKNKLQNKQKHIRGGCKLLMKRIKCIKSDSKISKRVKEND